jgi:hypothetical protein
MNEPPYQPVTEAITYIETGHKGWKGLPEVPLNGQNWPLDVAAEMLDIPLNDLRVLVRVFEIEPSGTAKLASFSRQGRQKRVYSAQRLIELYEAIHTFRRDTPAS